VTIGLPKHKGALFVFSTCKDWPQNASLAVEPHARRLPHQLLPRSSCRTTRATNLHCHACRFTYVRVKIDDYLCLFFTTAFLIHRLCQSVRRRDNKTEPNISVFKPAVLGVSKR
jgi:hypothetical protein